LVSPRKTYSPDRWRLLRIDAPGKIRGGTVPVYSGARISFILKNINCLFTAQKAIQDNMPLAQAFDAFRMSLRDIVINKLNMPLWNHLKDGVLNVHEAGVQQRYSIIQGHAILSPNMKRVANRLKAAQRHLANADLGAHFDARTVQLDAARSEDVAISLTDGINNARKALTDLEEMRRFTSIQTIATLRKWGEQPGCPCSIYVERRGQDFFIGKIRPGFRIILPDAFDEPLSQIPELDVTLRKKATARAA
jgi:hypothetical protein